MTLKSCDEPVRKISAGLRTTDLCAMIVTLYTDYSFGVRKLNIGNIFKITRAISRTTRPKQGLFILISMRFSYRITSFEKRKLRKYACVHVVRFQITVLVHFGSVWFWLVTVLIIVWPRSLLLCPFLKKLRIWWKKSLGFCQTDNPRFSCIMYCYRYRQLTSKNLEVSEFSTICKSRKRKSLVICTWDFP